MTVEMGTANYEARGRKEFNHFSLEDGTKYFRILPPLHSLAKNGQWFVYKPGHWVSGSPKPGKDKSQKRQFLCTLKKDEKRMVIQRCPMCEVVDGLRGQLAELSDAKGYPLPGNEAKAQELNLQIRNLQRGSYYYVNAIDMNTGKMGDLKLPYSSFTLLQEEISRIRSKKLSNGSSVDPLGKDEGLVFAFTRGKGDNGRYAFTVKVHQESKFVEGVGEVNIDVKFPLTDDIISRLGKESHDLSKLIRELSEGQIEAIIKNGVPSVDEIFEINKPKSNENGETAQAAPAQVESEIVPVGVTPAALVAAPAAEVAPASVGMAPVATTAPVSSPGILAPSITSTATTPEVNNNDAQQPVGNIQPSYSNMNDDQFRHFLKGQS